MIIETSSNVLYCVVPTNDPSLDHVWHGWPVKLVKGHYARKTVKGQPAPVELVRKAATRIVEG